MPVKRKQTKKRVYKKKAPITTLQKNTVNMGLGFPKKVIVTQKFRINDIMSSAAGEQVDLAFNLNSVYDPEVAIGGHQPMYTDQYLAIYNHYVVIGSKIRVKVYPYDGNLTPFNLVLWQNDDSTKTPTSIYELMEQTKSRSCIVDHTKPCDLSFKWSAKKTFGDGVLANSNLRGNASSNPSELSTAWLSVRPVDNVSAGNVAIQVYIDYIVCYFENKDIAGS